MIKLQVGIAQDEPCEWLVEQNESRLELYRDGRRYVVDILESNARGAVFLLDGKKYHVPFRNENSCSVLNRHVEVVVKTPGEVLRDTLSQSTGADTGAKDIKISMPGLVIKLLVTAGDQVQAGDELIIVEAMKMENVIKAPQSGLVEAVFVEPGQVIEKGATLLHLTGESPEQAD